MHNVPVQTHPLSHRTTPKHLGCTPLLFSPDKFSGLSCLWGWPSASLYLLLLIIWDCIRCGLLSESFLFVRLFVWSIFWLFFFFSFQNRILVCITGWPWTHDPLPSATWVLEIQVCAVKAGCYLILDVIFHKNMRVGDRTPMGNFPVSNSIVGRRKERWKKWEIKQWVLHPLSLSFSVQCVCSYVWVHMDVCHNTCVELREYLQVSALTSHFIWDRLSSSCWLQLQMSDSGPWASVSTFHLTTGTPGL